MSSARAFSRWFCAAAVLTGLVAFAGNASAFCRTTTCDASSGNCSTNDEGCISEGVPVIWTSLPIVYRFQADGSSKLDNDKVRAAVKAAFDLWQGVQCEHGQTSVRFQQGPDIVEQKPLDAKEASEPFGIYFRDDSWPHNDADETLALTNQNYGTRFGDINYADIEVNTAETDFTFSSSQDSTGIDFQSVFTHEAGHYLGLAHSTNDDSIMVARYCQSSDRCQTVEAKRALSDDDIAAVCDVYPPSGPSVTDVAADEAPSGCTTVPMTRGQLAGSFGLVFLASALVRRRLRGTR